MKKSELLTALHDCRSRAAAYLAALVVDLDDAHFWKHSPAHNHLAHPQHLLYGTWAGVHASILLGFDAAFSVAQRRNIANALNRFQRPDGTYLMAGVPFSGNAGYECEYSAFHCTNYALGALRALSERTRYPLSFMEGFMKQEELERWLDLRDWRRPWTEGNNVVNLASFFSILAEEGNAEAWLRLYEIADWLDRQQDKRTGFWCLAGSDGEDLRLAMAGAAHNLHVYYYLERAVPRGTAIIDSCLKLGHLSVQSACIDIDMVDILTNARRYGHRTGEVDRVLSRYLVELLDVQNSDGGFCDNYVTPHLLFGQNTPAGVSVTWATWFRLATIGMLVCALFPEQKTQWHFRRTLGTGYWNSNFALAEVSSTSGPVMTGMLPKLTRLWWTAKRKGRFSRQRLTSSIRQRLAF